MAKKRSRRRTRQLGERLARARLEQRGYRVLPADERGIDFYVMKGAQALPVKVMPIRYGNWQFSVDRLMEVSISRQGVQTIHSRIPPRDPDHICMLVKLDEEDVFILTMGELYNVVCSSYETWLAEHGGRRPRKPESMHCSATPDMLAAYRDNWSLLDEMMGTLLSRTVDVPADSEKEAAALVDVVRRVVRQFCLEFVEHPYLCYTEHGLHALLFSRIYDALPRSQRYTYWGGHKVCVVQKEYPTADALDKSKRQNWDVAVIQTPPISVAGEGQPSYDYLKLAAVVEFGMNETADHLQDDIDRLCHEKAHVDQGFIVHLYRLGESGAKVSGRDWSASSKRILSKEEAAKMGKGRPVEILYGLAGSVGTHEPGAWLIEGGKPLRLTGGE
jgi:hypothetical protein